MDSAYCEMKQLADLNGSLNTIVSHQNKMRRPPSLSESFAWEPENVERALRRNASSGTSINLLVTQESPVSPQRQQQQQQQQQPKSTYELLILTTLLRFLFHITLISIFESVFFFLYVSTLEDNGIKTTIRDLTNNYLTSCSNYSDFEKNITNDFLLLFINPTQVIEDGSDAYERRSITNAALFNRSWIYVGTLGSLFCTLALYASLRKLKIAWKELVLENIGLVLMLGLYEYMFFSTIIFPYTPISAPEIERNLVVNLQDSCGLLT